MREDIIIPIAFFVSVVVIVLYSVKYKHDFKMKLLEKDISTQDLGELLKSKRDRSWRDWSWTLVALQFGMLFLFVGFGIIAAGLLDNILKIGGAIYPAAIFTFAGIGLIGFYYMAKEERKGDQDELKK